MPYHKNTVSPQGIFKEIDNIKDDHLIHFSMTVAEKQQLCSILAECMLEEILDTFGADAHGEFYLHYDQLSPVDGIFDLGAYYKNVLVRGEQLLALKMNFDPPQISPVILTYKITLFTEFKFFFADSNKSSIIIFGNSVRPKGDYMDLHELIQSTINRLGTFL